jgi:hypothetical protein
MSASNGANEELGTNGANGANGNKRTEDGKKTCFIMMPSSSADSYEPGHFKRVYEYIVRPACKNAGFEPVREEDINTTNHIVIDVLKKVIEADMAVCDVSSQNPNVLYQLGVRQAFNLPVTLIKDNKTTRIFDIQGWREVQYDANMRIDKIEEAIPELTHALRSAYKDGGKTINSITQLLGIEPAKVTKTEVSRDTELLLEAIENVNRRLNRIENDSPNRNASANGNQQMDNKFVFVGNKLCSIGDEVAHPSYGEGVITNFSDSEAIVKFKNNNYIRFLLKGDSSLVSADLRAV